MTKFRKYGIVLALVLAVMMLVPMSALAVTEVATSTDLKTALANSSITEIKLTANITTSGISSITRDLTLDLNGHTLTRDTAITQEGNKPVLYVSGAYKLTINDSGSTGQIVIKETGAYVKSGVAECILLQNGANLILNGGNLGTNSTNNETQSIVVQTSSTATINGGKIYDTSCGITVTGEGATLNFNGGSIIASGFAITGNGSAGCGGTIINIKGGEMKATASDGAAIYHPQAGTLTISGGTLEGIDGVQFKGGTLIMTGGSITSTGTKPSKLEDNSNGSVATGAAISFVSNSNYAGNMKLNISGSAKLTANGSYAIWEDTTHGSSTQTVSVEISGGTFKGTPAAMYYKNWANITTKSITGGTYSSDPTEYVATGYIAIKNGDEYLVAKKTEEAPALPADTPATVEPTKVAEPAEVTKAAEIISSDKTTIVSTDLEVKDGAVVVKETVAKAAAEKAIETAGLKKEVKSVTPLPVFAGAVSEDKIAAVSLPFKGSELKATTAGAVRILKILGSANGKFFTFQSDASKAADGEFALQAGSSAYLASGDAIDANKNYTLVLFIKDNGDFDLNSTKGTIVDPAAIVETATASTPDDGGSTGSHSSGGGCNAGFAGLLLLAAAPMIWRRKK